jgi:hypothetical protein
VEVAHIDLPKNWIAKKMIKDKLSGFRYLRASFKVRLQVNAQPFNAGMLIMWFEPLYSVMAYNPSNTRHMGGITGYHHVNLNLIESTSAELDVPFCLNISHIDLVRGVGNLGRVHVMVYSPLTGSADVDGTLWLTAHDIDIQMPTGIDVKTAQMGLKAERKATKEGTISGIAAAAGRMASAARGIPLLSTLAGPVETGADLISRAANLFGFSKPENEETETAVKTGFDRHFANALGVSNSKVLALDPRIGVALQPSFGRTSEDEMALAHVLSQPVYMDSFIWSALRQPGDRLWTWPVHPSACNIATSTEGDTVHFNTYASYLCDLFAYCRGGIEYLITPVNCPYQIGRVRFTFVPGADESTNLNNVELDYCYSTVVDLRDNMTIRLHVPYISNKPWALTTDLHYAGQLTRAVPYGMLVATVVNALRAPSTAADNVEFIVETKMAEDFQFAFLDPDFAFKVVAGNEIGAAPTYTGARREAQSNFIPIPKTPPENAPIDQGVGEAVVSLRQLLKRNENSYSLLKDPVTGEDSTHQIFPYNNGIYVAEPTRETFAAQKLDVYSKVLALYRWQSGSVRLSLFSKETTSGITYYTLEGFNVTQTINAGRAEVAQVPLLERNMEITTPFYQNIVALPTQVGFIAENDGDQMSNWDSIPSNFGTNVTVFNAAGEPQISSIDRVYRHIGEDFGFMYLLGPPLTAILSA